MCWQAPHPPLSCPPPLPTARRSCLRLDGRTPAARRGEVLRSFSSCGPGSPTINLISLKAGGSGLNLISASRVRVYCSLVWSGWSSLVQSSLVLQLAIGTQRASGRGTHQPTVAGEGGASLSWCRCCPSRGWCSVVPHSLLLLASCSWATPRWAAAGGCLGGRCLPCRRGALP